MTRPDRGLMPKERAGARRLREAVDDGLGDVGARMAGGDPGHAEAGAQPLGREVAGSAGGRLEVARARSSLPTRST